ncbi:hypothetical protein WN55_02133 [Dufourea novaeangliae]|uniref:Uncharacterized protein n=1 Tax=Dufourea novaeangliae TaxID=178035 RepID=A0A154NYU3_DUFNO|nr:hypothetical protein WN55_02133 [Dufourea novaeangliae]
MDKGINRVCVSPGRGASANLGEKIEKGWIHDGTRSRKRETKRENKREELQRGTESLLYLCEQQSTPTYMCAYVHAYCETVCPCAPLILCFILNDQR